MTPASEPVVPAAEPVVEASEPATAPEMQPDPEPAPVAAFTQNEPAEAPAASEPAPAPPAPEEPPANPKHWYVVKVQSGREDTIKESIERRVRKEGLEEFFGQIVIPVEKFTEVKTDKSGKRVTKTKERKLYPGYLMVEVEYNDRILYLFRETSGVGDFVGGSFNRPPTPMSQREVDAMLGREQEREGIIQMKPKFDRGDRVRVGRHLAGMEGGSRNWWKRRTSSRWN
jgi:transcriptional antiterminator NusG